MSKFLPFQKNTTIAAGFLDSLLKSKPNVLQLPDVILHECLVAFVGRQVSWSLISSGYQFVRLISLHAISGTGGLHRWTDFTEADEWLEIDGWAHCIACYLFIGIGYDILVFIWNEEKILKDFFWWLYLVYRWPATTFFDHAF